MPSAFDASGADPAALSAWTAAVFYAVPALVWAIVCERTAWIARTRRPGSRLYALLPILAGGLALDFFLSGLIALHPIDPGAPAGILVGMGVLRDLGCLAAVMAFRHLLRHLPDREDPPSRAWIVLNYAPLVAVGALGVWSGGSLAYQILCLVLPLAALASGTWQALRISRGAPFGHAGLTAIRGADVAVLALGFAATSLLLHGTSLGRADPWSRSLGLAATEAAIGLVLAIPFAIRLLGEVLRSFLLAGTLSLATFAVYFGGEALFGALAPGSRRLGQVATLLVILLLLGPGQQRLRDGIDRLGFRRSRQRASRLHEVLHTLSPELGAVECVRRALAEFARVMEARGAAVLITPEGFTVSEGSIEIERVRRVWPKGEDAAWLFRSGFGLLEMRELPDALRGPLLEAKVVGAFPIVSPRRRWGHLFLASGILGTVITDEDGRVVHDFTHQLALVLDSTELLERVVAVERSLAHAEKLSAIGELAARIAHEIRNPVTAARSLAQSLCADPGAPENPEHAALILTELERVERQVAALLRYARREDLAREPVDLGGLVRETVDQFHMRLEGAGIAFDLDCPEGVVAQVDREKIRQVLINLIENSIDALAACDGERRIALRVARVNGSAELAVTDTGPGVPPPILEQIFEPFFSLKSHGTGLGLAIVKRTVEAHGGRIRAESDLGSGLSLRVDLPLPAAEARA